MSLVEFRNDDGIGILTINRPKALNALNKELLSVLSDKLDEISTDSSIRVLIITGSGEKSFVAGADINEMYTLNSYEASQFSELGSGIISKFEKLPQVVIAAINGYALGGGLELALGADLRWASKNATFGLPEVGLGVIPGFGGTQRLTRLVGISYGQEMLYTGKAIDVSKAEAIGLINEIVDSEDFISEVINKARKIARNSTSALALAKEAVYVGIHQDLDSALRLENNLFGNIFSTEDQKEGMGAFIEKRKANFTDKNRNQ